MPCLAPIHRTQLPDGKFRLSPADAEFLPDDNEIRQTIPCGRCICCRSDLARDWRVRIMHENLSHESSSFITLTYSDQHLPPSGGLNTRDWQLFAKRLRKKCGPFRFYQVGEYGEQTNRAHHHAIIFGLNFAFDRKFHKHSPKSGEKLYISETLNTAWGKGNCYIGEVTQESAGYCAAYATKKLYGVLGDVAYRHVDPLTAEVTELKPPFTTMSRRPGIGSDFFDRYGHELYREDNTIENGRRIPPPKYYDRLLEKTAPEKLATIREARTIRAHEKPIEKRSKKFLKGQERIKARRLAKSLREPR